MMKKNWIIASFLLVGVVALNVAPGYAQEPTIVGSWSITFFLEPNHSPGSTECFVFTLNPISVLGEPLSGQWTSTTVANWSGDWFQEGEHVQWYGSAVLTTGDLLATQEYGDLAGNDQSQGKFQHYFLLRPGSNTSTAGAWVGSRGCPAATQAPRAPNTDPAKPRTTAALTDILDAESALANLITTMFAHESAPPEVVAEVWAKFETEILLNLD